MTDETESSETTSDWADSPDQPDDSGDDGDGWASGLSDEMRDEIDARLSELRQYDYVNGVKALSYGVIVAPLMVVTPLLSVLPPTWKIYQKLSKWSAYQMQKAANADSVANVRLSNGKEDLRPAKHVESPEDDKDRSGWKIKGISDKRYDPAVHGKTTTRLGKADIIHINEDDTEQGTWTECAIDNAIQLDRERYLFRDATVRIKNLVYDYGGTDDPGGQAVADGGQAQRDQVVDVSIQKPGVLEDAVVPVGSREGYDGQVVSMNQYSKLKESQSDQETIREAKNQAWAAAKLDEIQGKDMIKWVLILGAIGLILLFHAEIGQFISSLGGGNAVGDAAGGTLR